MTDGPRVPEPAALAALVATARRLEAAARIERAGEAAATPLQDGTAGQDPLLVAVVATAASAMDAQAASIAVHDPATDRLTFVAAAGPAAGNVVGLTIDAAAGIAGYAFGTGQPLAIADVADDPRFDRSVAEATGYVPRSLLATPLVDDAGNAVGVLEVLDRNGGTFDLRALDLAAAFARQAAIIVGRSRLPRDGTALVRAALAAVGDQDGLDEAAVEAIVQAVTERAHDSGDATWRLADRLGALVGSDPDRLELAIDWLDALERRDAATRGRAGRGGRPGR